jgi:curved DNA-binding protein CbpA
VTGPVNPPVAPSRAVTQPLNPPPAAPSRAVTQPLSASPPAAGSGGAEVKEVLVLLEKMKQQNYLEVLGVPREADAGKVKIAYFKLAKLYHPDTVPQGSPEALAQAKADIFALIGEANRTLADAKLKADYLAELDAGGKKGEKVDITTLLQAEEFFQRGQVLVKNRKWVEAVKSLDDAIKANDKEGEYYGWRGWAKYFTLEEKDKSKAHIEALRDIEASLKANPNAASVHYFHGFLWKLKGDLAKAKASFKKCVELDPRHIDAQRELRTMAGK